MAISFVDLKCIGRKSSHWSTIVLITASFGIGAECQSTDVVSRYQKEGLSFDYGTTWELSDQSNALAHRLTLIDRALDAQVMVIMFTWFNN